LRSESEVSWIRARNVGALPRTSRWHALIPGLGVQEPPGAACGVGLAGSFQVVPLHAIGAMDGEVHDLCRQLVQTFIGAIDTSPGPYTPDEEPPVLAPPGQGG
jgi:hypothetical protein